MVIVTHPPHRADRKQRANCAPASTKRFAASTDFAADESEDCRNQQSEKQSGEHDRLKNEDDVPRIPMPIERQEWPNAVVVSEIEQNMAENGKNPKKEQKPPAR